MWEICGHTLNTGEKKQVILEPNVPGYKMPATLICGAGEGKTVLITAQIHSGEYPGTPAVIHMAKEIDPGKLCGNLVMIHCVNTSGFWAKSDARIPEDQVNLNADYPGKPDGSTGLRIADYFVKEIFPKVDFVCDLHSGGATEPLTPCLFFPKAEKVTDAARKAAMDLDIPNLIASWNQSGEVGYAAFHCDIPGLLLENGHSSKCEPEWVAFYEKNLRLLLAHLSMLPLEQPLTICRKTVYEKAVYLEADVRGLWYPAVSENMDIREGQYLGKVEDFFGNLLKEYYAEGDGKVFYYTSALAIRENDPLVAYGLSEFAVPEP